MNKEEWINRYCTRMVRLSGITEAQARESAEASLKEFGMDDDPKYSADEEMSCWGE